MVDPLDPKAKVLTEWHWVGRMALVDLICDSFHCTPDVALQQDPRLVLPLVELRMLREGKQLHNTEGGMKEFSKHPYLVALWLEMTRSDDG